MKILQDLHIHSHHSCDSAAATLPDIKSERDALGLQHYAVTDHLHTRYNISDIESCRHAFLGYNFPENYHFGIEVSCVGTRECERVAAGDFIASGDTPIYGFRDEPELFDGRISIDLTEEDIKKQIQTIIEERYKGFEKSKIDIEKHPILKRITYIVLPIWELDQVAKDFQNKI